MCVIAVCLTSRLTDEQVKAMWAANSFGGGVAWRAIDGADELVTVWEKGLTEDQMRNRNSTVPLPYVLHFRKPSVGTAMTPDGCHPFVIDKRATCDLKGRTTERVLFHNGYWTGWEDYILNMKGHISSGAWSDSRALALRTFRRGLPFLQILDERVVCFGPTDIQMFGTWKVLPNKGGHILISNNGWERDSCHISGPICLPERS